VTKSITPAAQTAVRLAFRAAQATHREHETQGAAQDEACGREQRRIGGHARATQTRAGQSPRAAPEGGVAVAEATTARFHQQTHTAKRQSRATTQGMKFGPTPA
jgi:hypothetical protein